MDSGTTLWFYLFKKNKGAMKRLAKLSGIRYANTVTHTHIYKQIVTRKLVLLHIPFPCNFLLVTESVPTADV